MPTTSRRRWFQFRLTTMFVVVTAVAVWLGWEMKFVRERQVMRRRILESGGELWPGDIVGYEHAAIPYWRTWLGDEPVSYINPGRLELTEDAARRVFPELQLFGNQFGPS